VSFPFGSVGCCLKNASGVDYMTCLYLLGAFVSSSRCFGAVVAIAGAYFMLMNSTFSSWPYWFSQLFKTLQECAKILITIFIFYQGSFRLVATLKFIYVAIYGCSIIVLIVCFKLINFVSDIPFLGPENSSRFIPYIVYIISMHLALLLQYWYNNFKHSLPDHSLCCLNF
jgi:hypothetical protein